MFLSNVDLSRFSECFSPPKQVLRIKQDQRGGRSGVSEEPPLPKYLSHFHPPDHFFWQLTKQTWSTLTETLLIKTVLVLRMVVVLVFSSCDRDPPQVSVRVQPGRQLHILLWVELFVHLRYSIMSKLSFGSREKTQLQNISNSTWLILTKRVRTLMIVLLPSESDHYKITTIISIDYWPL